MGVSPSSPDFALPPAHTSRPKTAAAFCIHPSSLFISIKRGCVQNGDPVKNLARDSDVARSGFRHHESLDDSSPPQTQPLRPFCTLPSSLITRLKAVKTPWPMKYV